MAGAVDAKKQNLLSAFDVFLVNFGVLYTPWGRGLLIFKLDRYVPPGRVWFSRALVGAVLPV